MSKQKQSENRVCVLRNVGIILVGVAVFSLLVGVVSATTWTVDESGSADFTRIQDAINVAHPGDTIEVRSGTYYGNVNMDKWLILRGMDTDAGKPVVDAGGSGSAVTISANGCVVDGFTITGSGPNWGEAGIKITSENNEIKNNNISNNNNGIFFEEPFGEHSSYYNTVTNNIVCYNNEKGIYVYRSHYNIITNNTVNSNINDGIKLAHSSHNLLTNNVANSNKDDGIGLSEDSEHNILTNNTANLNYEGGIGLYKSSNNTFIGNSVSGNEDGFGLTRSNNNTFINNAANSNTDCGIYLDSLSNNNSITNNNISSNNDNGVNLDDSFYNIISNNIILNNSIGVYLDHSSNNIVINNIVSLNSDDGIGLEDSANNNAIISNTISSNKDTGVFIELSNNNKIYHNNFINNADQACDYSNNSWDNGYPSGGNYWSDYTGEDYYSGPNQDMPSSDGIGDTPYNISGAVALDMYPFMNENGWITPSTIFDTPSPIPPISPTPAPTPPLSLPIVPIAIVAIVAVTVLIYVFIRKKPPEPEVKREKERESEEEEKWQRKGGGKKKMLFMGIFTWEPEKGDEAVKRRATEKIPEGIKVVGEWKDLGRGRIFRLFEAVDPKVILAMSSAWEDLGKGEIVPVMETEEVLKLLPKG